MLLWWGFTDCSTVVLLFCAFPSLVLVQSAIVTGKLCVPPLPAEHSNDACIHWAMLLREMRMHLLRCQAAAEPDSGLGAASTAAMDVGCAAQILRDAHAA